MTGPFAYSKILRSCVIGLDGGGAGSLEEGGAAPSGPGAAQAAGHRGRATRLQQLEQSIPKSARLAICVVGLQVSGKLDLLSTFCFDRLCMLAFSWWITSW